MKWLKHVTQCCAAVGSTAMIMASGVIQAQPTVTQSQTSTTAHAPYSEQAGCGLGLEMVWIPPGSFDMGSPDSERERFKVEGVSTAGESPVHRVTLDGFWLGKCEVTVGQFKKFVDATSYKTDAEKNGKSYGFSGDGANPWKLIDGLTWRNPGFTQTDMHPVVHVSWNDAVQFVDWLGEKPVSEYAIRSGKRYRLPSEAQWEYACRAGSGSAFCWGGDPGQGAGWLNGRDASFKGRFPENTRIWADKGAPPFDFDDGFIFTSPVGRFKPNAFGFYDMHGNVWELCRDWYDEGFYKTSGATARNPENTTEAAGRVNRGGGWNGTPQGCRSANRGRIEPGDSLGILGFRAAAVPAAGQ